MAACQPLKVSRLSSAGEYDYEVLVPGIDQVRSCVNVNESHASYSHANEGLLRDTAARIGVTPKGKLHPAAVHGQRALGMLSHFVQLLGQTRG